MTAPNPRYRLLDGSVVARYDGRIPGDSPAKFLAAHPAEACYFYVAEGTTSPVYMLTEADGDAHRSGITRPVPCGTGSGRRSASHARQRSTAARMIAAGVSARVQRELHPVLHRSR